MVTGPRLAPDPIPFEALSAFVRKTIARMPPYRKEILSDADLADIYAYLQSIPKPPNVQGLHCCSNGQTSRNEYSKKRHGRA